MIFCRRNFDIAGFAVNAIPGVNDETWFRAAILIGVDDLVDRTARQ